MPCWPKKRSCDGEILLCFFFLTLCYFQEGEKVSEEHKATEAAQNPADYSCSLGNIKWAGEVSVQPHLEVEQALVPFDLILREPRKEYTRCKQCAVWFWWEINCSQ